MSDVEKIRIVVIRQPEDVLFERTNLKNLPPCFNIRKQFFLTVRLETFNNVFRYRS